MTTSDQRPYSTIHRPRLVRLTDFFKKIVRRISYWTTRHKLLAGLLLMVLLVAGGSLVWMTTRQKPAVEASNPVVAAYQKQLPDLKQKASSNPKDPVAHANYAVALYATRDLDGAKQQYETAVQLNSTDAATYNNLGNVYRDLRQTDKAIVAYQKSIALNPKSVNTYANLANVQLYAQSKPAEAINTYQQGLKQLPGNTQLELLLGIAHEQAGDIAAARQTYQLILTQDKTNKAAQSNLNRLNK